MLANLFLDNVLPPLLIVAVGYLLDRTQGVELRTLSRVALYVFTPALILGSLVESRVGGGEFGKIALFVVLFTGLLWAGGLALGRLLRFSQRQTNAFLLSTLFTNCGNYGLAVVLFAFGQPGLERGLVFFVVSALLTHTLAAYFASRGAFSVGQSVRNIFRLPLVYAVVAALAVRALGVTLPTPVLRAISLPRAGAIPIMQLLLGVQLARVSRGVDRRFIALAVAVRLVGGAALAVGLSTALGLEGLARSVSIVQASMPTAVSTLALSVEFGSDPEEVGSAIFFSTLGSAVTLTVLLAYL